jgi:hypothetical protein
MRSALTRGRRRSAGSVIGFAGDCSGEVRSDVVIAETSAENALHSGHRSRCEATSARSNSDSSLS